MRGILSLIVVAVAVFVNSGSSSRVHFFPGSPKIQPASVEIHGVAIESDEQGFIVDGKEPIQSSELALPDVESRRISPKDSGPVSPQQRILGLGLGLGFGNLFIANIGKTQTIIQTTRVTSYTVPLCILCSCRAGALNGCGVLGAIPILGGQPAVCGAGANVVPPPSVCPSRKRRFVDEGFSNTEEEEDIQPSRILQLTPSEEPTLNPRSLSVFPLSSSMEESSGRELNARAEEGFRFVVTSFVTTLTTAIAPNTAQIQVGGLNCLPTYLSNSPTCARLGF